MKIYIKILMEAEGWKGANCRWREMAKKESKVQ